jgi:hypothetical protein
VNCDLDTHSRKFAIFSRVSDQFETASLGLRQRSHDMGIILARSPIPNSCVTRAVYLAEQVAYYAPDTLPRDSGTWADAVESALANASSYA